MNTQVFGFEPLTNDVTTDVCVIGAGIAGLMTAHRLLEQGQRVIVLEQDTIGSGETGRTTAHLTALLDSRYRELEREHGRDGALLAAESHLAGIAEIERLVGALAIECEFQRLDAYLYEAEPGSESKLDEELGAARRAGLSVEKIEHLPLPFATGRALRFERQAELHPLKFLNGLVQGIERLGGRIFLHTHVTGVETGDPAVVRTAAGAAVRAKAVVVATNTPINALFAMHTKQAAYRTYAIAGAVPRGVLAKGLYWDTEDPYHYLRLASAAEAGSLPDHEWLIVGGEDHKVGQADDPEASWTRLEAWTRNRLPMLEAVVYRWSGQVSEPADGLGFIGLSPGGKNVYVITGHSGNGTTYAALAAILLSDLIAGRPNRWSALYDPSRKPLGRSGIARFAQENLNVARHYGDWLTPGTAGSAQAIARGEGAVVRRGLKKLAVYVDDNGVSHERSAVCTHLGCIVNWNSAEKSWDCPCHGSRFNCYGKVLTGPATRDLDAIAKPEPRVARPRD